MKTARTIVSITLSLAAALALLFSVFSIDTSSVQRTIDNSRKIEVSFQQAVAYLDGRIRETGLLPTAKEFEAWSSAFRSQPYGINGMRLDLPPYRPEFTLEHGQPPKNGYALSYWRGDWEESYVSWTKKSSLVFDKSAYFLFGSPTVQTIVFSLITLVLAIVAFRVWPRQQPTA